MLDQERRNLILVWAEFTNVASLNEISDLVIAQAARTGFNASLVD